MFKIGEFSRLSQVTVKALHHYDDVGLLKPAHVDPDTGYRYYTAAQMPRLNRLLALKDLGLSLQEIGILLADDLPPEQLRGMLRRRRAELQQHLDRESQRLARVEMRLTQIQEDNAMPDYEVVMKSVPAQSVAALRGTVPTYADIEQLFNEICPFIEQNKVQWIGPPVALYHDMEYRERDVDIEVCVPVAGAVPDHPRIRAMELPACPAMACTIHKGPYEKLIEAYTFMMQWIEDNGYRITGPDREVYLQGPEPGTNPADYVTEILFPVEKAAHA